MAAILFFCDVLVPSLKNTAPIFLKIFLNQCFIISGTAYDIITFIICIIQKHRTKEFIPKREISFF